MKINVSRKIPHVRRPWRNVLSGTTTIAVDMMFSAKSGKLFILTRLVDALLGQSSLLEFLQSLIIVTDTKMCVHVGVTDVSTIPTRSASNILQSVWNTMIGVLNGVKNVLNMRNIVLNGQNLAMIKVFYLMV